jgi:hypothetical protein
VPSYDDDVLERMDAEEMADDDGLLWDDREVQVRFCRHQVFPYRRLGYNGIRGAEG